MNTTGKHIKGLEAKHTFSDQPFGGHMNARVHQLWHRVVQEKKQICKNDTKKQCLMNKDVFEFVMTLLPPTTKHQIQCSMVHNMLSRYSAWIPYSDPERTFLQGFILKGALVKITGASIVKPTSSAECVIIMRSTPRMTVAATKWIAMLESVMSCRLTSLLQMVHFPNQ
jgi:hypothetical protein